MGFSTLALHGIDMGQTYQALSETWPDDAPKYKELNPLVGDSRDMVIGTGVAAAPVGYLILNNLDQYHQDWGLYILGAFKLGLVINNTVVMH